VDLVISPSKFALEFHKENGFFINTEKRILPHGIDLDLHRSEDKTIAEGSKKSTIDILYTGGLTKHKGIHVLIKAFRQISNFNLRLHIIGGGVYERDLRLLSGEDKRIIFHGKFANKEMRQFYHEADVLVVPSIWYDVRPNVIPEAFREGVPVIGADIGGIPELVIENQTGFLFKAGDAGDLKRVLETVIKDPQALKRLRKNVLEFVNQFEMSQYLDKLAGVYRQAIEINNRKKTASKAEKIS
jgi:glycosyltransferase involved in cell wall biosynthesis